MGGSQYNITVAVYWSLSRDPLRAGRWFVLCPTCRAIAEHHINDPGTAEGRNSMTP